VSGREVNLDKRALFLGQPSKQRIFISYRRDDAQWAAGRLADALSAYFGDQRVFRDIDGIAGGADFGDVIQENLGTADAVIVLIGPDWLDAADSQGRQRLQNPTDWVVREVATALEKGVPIYPVLVAVTWTPAAGGMSMAQPRWALWGRCSPSFCSTGSAWNTNPSSSSTWAWLWRQPCWC